MKRSKFIDEQTPGNCPRGRGRAEGADLTRTHGITERTCYRWKPKYGGMELSEMQRLKQLEDENRRPKQILPRTLSDTNKRCRENIHRLAHYIIFAGPRTQNGSRRRRSLFRYTARLEGRDTTGESGLAFRWCFEKQQPTQGLIGLDPPFERGNHVERVRPLAAATVPHTRRQKQAQPVPSLRR